ncbi:MAG: DnaJ domain, partial [Pedosphaera sp.]|nr:DnaJ domain [Pedosphaera sp.]
TAGITVIVLMAAHWLLAGMGISVALVQPGLFAGLFLLFLGLSTAHAYKTRWGTEAAADVDLGSALSSFRSLSWEFFSVGPILLVLAGQEFYRYVRFSRLDVPQVSALLLWLYDKGGRAGFAEIRLAFPGLNAVRVLPQLRDLPGINWWPEDGEVSLSEDVRKTFEEILGREPKSSSHFGRSSGERQHFQEPVSEVDVDIIAWYAALHLPLFAPLQRVKAQYRKLAKIHHPDTRSGSSGGGQTSDDEQMKRINEAYHNILKHSRQQAGTPC